MFLLRKIFICVGVIEKEILVRMIEMLKFPINNEKLRIIDFFMKEIVLMIQFWSLEIVIECLN